MFLEYWLRVETHEKNPEIPRELHVMGSQNPVKMWVFSLGVKRF